MMDPLTIVSLTSNIVQLGDASIKVAAACYEIYKHGATLEVAKLLELAEQLDRCYEQTENFFSTRAAHDALQSEQHLSTLSTKCRKTAQKLQSELKKCTTTSSGARLQAMVKSLVNAKKIEKIQKSLKDEQKTLEHFIQVDLSQRIHGIESKQESQNVQLQQKLDTISVNLKSCQTAASDDLKALIEDVFERHRQEHEQTRNQIVDDNRREHEITRQQIQNISEHADHRAIDSKEELRESEKLFLESLQFQEIRSRENEITESFPDTFGWIFEPPRDQRRINFIHWLKNGDRLYWISGKAGSGKSTLMKFIADSKRTSEALKLWAGSQECVTIAIFFWLSGSNIQRNMKGFLCSFLNQLFEDFGLLRDFLRDSHATTRKRYIGDWSIAELKKALDLAIKLAVRDRNIFVLLDGLDEFERAEIDQLLHYIDSLCNLPGVKICASSRPETHLGKHLSRFPHLKLQDLTETDMKICIENELGAAWRQESSVVAVNPEKEKRLIRMILRKADGVFLWVQFALQSVLRGINNEDDFEVLYQRIEELPNGMQELYEEMWKRHNGDERHYQQEASKYFGFHRHFPLSAFEMMVACEPKIQEEYLANLTALDRSYVLAQCRNFQKRVQVRCAGLLQVNAIKGLYLNHDRTQSLTRTVRTQSSLSSLKRFAKEMNEGVSWEQFSRLQVSFIHRTARDFLLNTEAGQMIAGGSLTSNDQQVTSLAKALMAAQLQRLMGIYSWRVYDILDLLFMESEPKFILQLTAMLYQICEKLSGGGREPSLEYRYSFDLSTLLAQKAAEKSRFDVLQPYIENQAMHMSSYYLGHLFTTVIMDSSKRHTRFLETARLLVRYNADLRTYQWQSESTAIIRPIEALIKVIFDDLYRYSEIGAQGMFLGTCLSESSLSRADTFKGDPLEDVLEFLEECIRTSLSRGEKVFIKIAPWHGEPGYLIFDLNADYVVPLFRWMYKVNTDEYDQSWTPQLLKDGIRMLAFTQVEGIISGDAFIILESADAELLGQSFIRTILRIRKQGKIQSSDHVDFTELMEEVKPRCEISNYRDCLRTKGRYADRKPGARFLSSSQHVDETNWWNVGWGLESLPRPRELRYGVVPANGSNRPRRRRSDFN